jgi:saccharopine dehydrogenase-like NADP-dependent oxidoreductase
MRVLAIGSGGVGTSAALIAKRREFFDLWICADFDLNRSQALADRVTDPRFVAARIDAANTSEITAMCQQHGITHVLNVIDPRYVMPIFDGAFAAGANYLDTAMSLSRPHPTLPHENVGVMLGDEQFAKADEWQDAGLLALCGVGVEPGLSDIFARYAADHLFSEIDEIGIRDGANLTVAGYDFAPSFSIWTTIEECLNPPVIWESDKGWFTTAPFSEPEVFDFPEGIGPVECVNVEHEEVLLVPRWIKCKRVTFKYGLGDEFIEVLKTLHKLGLDSTTPVNVEVGLPVSRFGQRLVDA